MQLTTLPQKLTRALESKLAEFDRIGENASSRQMDEWGPERRQILYSYMKLKNLCKRLDYMNKVPRIRVHRARDINELKEQITALENQLQDATF